MSGAADLVVHGAAGWLRLLVGVTVFLLPGMAAADRLLAKTPLRFVWAPLFSFTLLALAAILLDFGMGLAIRPAATAAIAFVLALAIGQPRWQVWLSKGFDRVKAPRSKDTSWSERSEGKRRSRPRAHWWGAAALLVVLPLVWVVASLPHLPGQPVLRPADAPQELAERGLRLVEGDDVPYPVHVDEHYHLAQLAEIDRTGLVDIPDPYTGEPSDLGLFTVGGMRTERGWQIGLVQVHHLTGASFPTLAHFLPGLWSAYLALVVWAALRPAPGAWASAAFVILVPTTVRFLGIGFLIPSSFALPWIIAVMSVAVRARGPGRFVALLLLITGAFFVHLVPGVLALFTGLTASLLHPADRRDRLALAVSVALPLLWIYPSIHSEVVSVVSFNGDLPFEDKVFRTAGLGILALAVAGTAGAWYRREVATVPHRVLTVLCFSLAVVMALSIDNDHHSDATYSRLVQPFFLTLGCLAGLGVGLLQREVARLPVRRMALAGALLAAIVAGAAALHPLQARLNEPYYRVFDDASWTGVAGFADSGAGPDDIFLAHPWQAPVLNAVSGARPWTVLYPGAPPERGADYDYYVGTQGADSGWLASRSIDWVIAPVAPNANHTSTSTWIHHVSP